MIINQWKRNPDDPFTVLEVPSKRASECLVMIGAKIVGYKHKPSFVNTEFIMLHMPDALLEKGFALLRELKSKGIDFDKE